MLSRNARATFRHCPSSYSVPTGSQQVLPPPPHRSLHSFLAHSLYCPAPASSMIRFDSDSTWCRQSIFPYLLHLILPHTTPAQELCITLRSRGPKAHDKNSTFVAFSLPFVPFAPRLPFLPFSSSVSCSYNIYTCGFDPYSVFSSWPMLFLFFGS
jgi:hypothetical protein